MANGQIHKHQASVSKLGFAADYKNIQWVLNYGDTARYFELPQGEVPTPDVLYPLLQAAIIKHDEGSKAYAEEQAKITAMNEYLGRIYKALPFRVAWPAEFIKEHGFIPIEAHQPLPTIQPIPEHTHDKSGAPVYTAEEALTALLKEEKNGSWLLRTLKVGGR